MMLIESQPINNAFIPNSTTECMCQNSLCCCYKYIDEQEYDCNCCMERSYSLISDNTDYICAFNVLMCHNVLYSFRPFVCQLCYVTSYSYRYPRKKYQYLCRFNLSHIQYVTGCGLQECLLCSNVEI